MSSDSAVDHADVLVARLAASHPEANPMTLDALDDDEVKAQLPAQYCEVYVTERVAEGGRYGGRDGVRAWRAQFRAVGSNAYNAERVREWVRDEFEDKPVTVGGVESTALLRGASDDPIRPDDGWYSGLSEFTYYC